MKQVVNINGCTHYKIQYSGAFSFFQDNIIPCEMQHPFGVVCRPRNNNEEGVRFVRQDNGAIWMFRKNEWEHLENPFYHPDEDNLPAKFIFARKMQQLRAVLSSLF